MPFASAPAALTATHIRTELVRCAAPGGFRWWVEHYAKIEDQQKGDIPFELWPVHDTVIRDLEEVTRLVVLKARQIGMSWLLGALYPTWLSMFHPNTLCMLFSQREEEASELIRKCKFVWTRLPPWMQVPLSKDNAMELAFGGMESRILAFPSKPDAGSGYTARYVFSDEHAKQPYAREQYTAIRPTIDMGGQYVSGSSARGAASFHNQLYQQAKRGVNGFRARFFPYNCHPHRDQQWWDDMRSTYPEEWQFFQEYPRTDDEAVQSSQPRRFQGDYLRLTAGKLERHTPDALVATGDPDLQALSRIQARHEELGVAILQLPVRGRDYVIGADVAEGLSTGDFSACTVLDRVTGEEVATLQGRWSVQDYAVYLDHLAQAYGALLAIERNNHGLACIMAVQRLQVERLKRRDRAKYTLYMEKPILSPVGQVVRPGRPGWLTTAASKPMMLAELEGALKEYEVKLGSEATLQDLASVVEDEDTHALGAKAPLHDDLAMALAVAWQALVRTAPARARPRIPYTQGPGDLSKGEPRRLSIFKRTRRPSMPAKRVPLLQRLAQRTSERVG